MSLIAGYGIGLVRKTDEDCGAVDGDRWER